MMRKSRPRRIGRATAALAATVLAVTLGGCGDPTWSSTVDEYDDAYLTELRDVLVASEIVSDTGVEPGFFERPANIPPRFASVELVEGAELADLPTLFEEVSVLAEQYDDEVPPLRFGPLAEPAEFLQFSGRITAAGAEELFEYILDGAWQWPRVHVGGDGPGAMYTTQTLASFEDLEPIAVASAEPLPSVLDIEEMHQDFQIEEPHMIGAVELGGARLTPEILEALRLIETTDGDLVAGMPLPVISIEYGRASDGYIHSARVGVHVEDFADLDREEIRVRAEAAGYPALCEATQEILADIADLRVGTTSCRVNSTRI